ncbi:TPA: phage holin, partial [Streptococcus suis]|nr:phage holin [Streptococcus suis]HEM6473155.1 phage holin [Streptococcus suis]
MNHLTELILGTATGIFGIVAGVTIHEIKKYLIAKGGKRAIE